MVLDLTFFISFLKRKTTIKKISSFKIVIHGKGPNIWVTYSFFFLAWGRRGDGLIYC